MTHHFDAKAETWDEDPKKIERSRRLADRIADAVALTGQERVLEYGAATGLVAEALGERAGSVTLADNSAGMREVLQRKLDAGVFGDSARVWDLDLAGGAVPDEEFDVIVTTLVLHHIPEVQQVLSGFRELVSPRGWVCIVDLDEEDGRFHAHHDEFDGHDGFDREHLRAWLYEAGFTEVTFADAGTLEKDGEEFGLFLATARPAG